jgi:hypothetical protein
MQGRLSEFWCPNWQRDLELTSDTPSGGDALNIRRIDYDTTYADLIGRTDVAIRLRDKNILLREITGSAILSASLEQLQVLPAFEAGLFRSEIAQISWLELMRLATDDVTISWDTAEVCRVSLPLLSLIQ